MEQLTHLMYLFPFPSFKSNTTLKIYKEWQEAILGRPVALEDFVLQWEINLLQNYVCHTGKVSRKWKEIYHYLNKCRVKAKKEELPYGRIHDGRHTHVSLSQGYFWDSLSDCLR